MNNNSSMIGLVLVSIVACVLFACAGAWATLTLGNAAHDAESAIAAALGDDTEQSARAVCVAGIANLGSCNVSQTQTRTQTQPADDAGEPFDWLAWSGLAIAGLAVICFAGVVAMALEPRR